METIRADTGRYKCEKTQKQPFFGIKRVGCYDNGRESDKYRRQQLTTFTRDVYTHVYGELHFRVIHHIGGLHVYSTYMVSYIFV